jgi:hypothetical protein
MYYFGLNIVNTYKILIFFCFNFIYWLSQFQTFEISPKVHNIVIKFGIHLLLVFWNVKNYTPW